MKKLLILFVAVIAVSCSDKAGSNGNDNPISKVIDTKDYTQWTYFSFEKGIIGTYTEDGFDYKNSLDWDIAFHRWDIRTNSGLSGKGKGGALETKFTTLSARELSNAGGLGSFTTDEMIKTYMAPPNMQAEDDNTDQRVDVPANTVLGKWLTVTMSMPPKREINNNVFIVRTANGEFAAIKFTNYMNEKAESGYVNFSYLYPLN